MMRKYSYQTFDGRLVTIHRSKTQSFRNNARKVIFQTANSECDCSERLYLLRELHWLKVLEGIQFRLCVLAYRCLIGTATSYLAETLHLTADVGSRRRLRSASTSTLVIRSRWVIEPSR